MTKCRLESDDVCISCRVCGADLFWKIREMEKSIEEDIGKDIQYYPISLVRYLLSVLKKELDDGEV